MKKLTLLLNKLPLIIGMLAAATPCLKAQIITAVGAPFVISSTTAAPGSSSDYDYFSTTSFGDSFPGVDPHTNPINLTNFSVTQEPNAGDGSYGSYGVTGYAQATAPDGTGPFVTIVQFNHPDDTVQTLLTFQLINPTETNFNVFVLTGTDATSGEYELSSNGSASSDIFATVVNSEVDEYQEFSVTGANTSETFTLSAIGSGDVAGITFEAATPEPSTWAMMLGGLGVLFAMFRRRNGASV